MAINPKRIYTPSTTQNTFQKEYRLKNFMVSIHNFKRNVLKFELVIYHLVFIQHKGGNKSSLCCYINKFLVAYANTAAATLLHSFIFIFAARVALACCFYTIVTKAETQAQF